MTSVHSLDQAAKQHFLAGLIQPLKMPDAILSEYILRTPTMHNIYAQRPPQAEYQAAIGYEFPWGHILERRTNQYVVWDFCLSHLLLQYLQAGLRLEDCQKQVFRALERQFDCTTRDAVILVGSTKTWALTISSSVGVFSQVVHFTAETAAREWAAHVLVNALPEIIARIAPHKHPE